MSPGGENKAEALLGWMWLAVLKRWCFSDCYLAQHVVLLHIVNLSRVDLSFEGVLKELAADIKQQGASRPFLQRAARGGLVVVAGGRDAVSQDHTHQQTWGNHSRGMMTAW